MKLLFHGKTLCSDEPKKDKAISLLDDISLIIDHNRILRDYKRFSEKL